MSKIVIGKCGARNVSIDLDVLLRTRLLVQSNSGGGKSWAIRRLCEQAFGKVQILVIDPEGEFASLREKYGFVLVGQGGETPADVRSAPLLAQRLLELRASAVCDIYEAFRKSPSQRRAWVAAFLESLVDAPKTLWHPVLVIVDESHKFCPQEMPRAGSSQERADIMRCKEAMISLATTGRKRAFCAVWATQRLAKLDKDASAELLNRMVGLTFEDVDIDRAVDLLSVSKDEKHDFKKGLRVLEPGNFYAIGRAITTDRVLIRVGGVETTHPEIGSGAQKFEPPPPPHQIKALLPKLADLPKEAEDKARTEAEMRKEIRELKRDLSQAKKSQPAPPKQVQVQVPIKDITASRANALLRKLLDEAMKIIAQISLIGFDKDKPVLDEEQVRKALDGASAQLVKLAQASLSHRQQVIDGLKHDASRLQYRVAKMAEDIAGDKELKVDVTVRQNAPVTVSPKPSVARVERPVVARNNGSDKLRAGAERMLAALVQWQPNGMHVSQMRSHAGMKKSGTFTTYMSDLRMGGYMEQRGDGLVYATDAGVQYFGGNIPDAPSTTEEVLAVWKPKLRGGACRMLDVLVEAGGEPVPLEELTERAGMTKSGTFTTYLSDLRTARLIVTERGTAKANKETLFL